MVKYVHTMSRTNRAIIICLLISINCILRGKLTSFEFPQFCCFCLLALIAFLKPILETPNSLGKGEINNFEQLSFSSKRNMTIIVNGSDNVIYSFSKVFRFLVLFYKVYEPRSTKTNHSVFIEQCRTV